MDTRRAKTAVIVILIMLNAAVFLLNWQNARAFVLRPAAEEAIVKTLEERGILLEASFERVRDFSPRRPMLVSAFDYAPLEALLLGDGEITEAPGFEETVKVSEKGRLTVRRNALSFEASDERDVQTAISPEDARMLTDAFLDEFKEKAGFNFGFRHYYTHQRGQTFSVLYMAETEDGALASNTALFIVDAGGIAELNCQLSVPEGLAGAPREICSADEALFTLWREAPEQYPDGELIVTDMEIVYFMAERSGGSEASPCYMFAVRQDGWEPERLDRHLVNAYTNEYYYAY